ncbi:MFS transporter [Thermopolyspora sp. NPDC052614]|uniref:MFS transporter n=1 Tax=Thermopolyspora sp. NPDC052614 TaxID=3155682 RepID=UPI003425DFAD
MTLIGDTPETSEADPASRRAAIGRRVLGPLGRVHRAWFVAAVAFVAILGAAGFRATPGVMIDPLREEFGWSRAAISLAVSVNLVLYGLTAPFAAALMDRFGMRRVVTVALLLVAAGSGFTIWMNASWQLVATWGVLVGLGTGSMALVFVATVTDRWFVRHRGVVTGALTAAGATGQLVFLPILAHVIHGQGWRAAALTVAGAALAVVPLVWFLLRDRPEDVGTTALGAPTGGGSSTGVAGGPATAVGNGPTEGPGDAVVREPSSGRVDTVTSATVTSANPAGVPEDAPTPASMSGRPGVAGDGGVGVPAGDFAPTPASMSGRPGVAADGAVSVPAGDFADEVGGDLSAGTSAQAAPAAGGPATASRRGVESARPQDGPALRAVRVLWTAARTRAFWFLAGGFAICGMSTNGLVGTHFIPAAHDHGMPQTTAASLLALIGIFDIVGTVASGWLSDRIDPRVLLGVYYGLRGASLLILPQLFAATTEPSMLVFVVFYGLDWVATVPPTVALCRQIYGADGAVVFGWVFASHQVGAAIAAFAAGFTRDQLGAYTLAWYGAGLLCLLAALMSLRVGPGLRARAGLNRAGLNRGGLNRAGLNRAGLNRAGLNGGGLNGGGLNRGGLNRGGRSRGDLESCWAWVRSISGCCRSSCASSGRPLPNGRTPWRRRRKPY